MDFFPCRRPYVYDLPCRLLFLGARIALIVFSYVLLLPASSSPLCADTLKACPSGIPDVRLPLFDPLSSLLGLSPPATIVFLGILLPSVQFTLYNFRWRREALPLGGQGGGVQVATQVNIFDLVHVLVFAYLARFNPTWSPALFQAVPPVFALGLALHFAADESKYRFKLDPRNKGKVYASGVWGLVRHPNYLGFTLWRTAFAATAGGWGLAALILANFVYLFGDTAVPVEEAYMEKTYGAQWRAVTEKVKWKMVPGVW